MMNNYMNIKCILLLFSIIIFLISCGNDTKDSSDQNKGKYESMRSGKIHALCEDGLFELMSEPFDWYQTDYPDAKLTIDKVTTRFAMSKLLAAEIKVVITARDYLADEDSLMKKFDVKPHIREVIANDALIFFVNENYPIDTMSSEQIKNVITDSDVKLSDYYPQIFSEPVFAVNSYLSSEYENFVKLVAENKPISKHIKHFNGTDSVKQFVLKNPGAIGIGYLSHITKDTNNFKALSIGFVDSTGKYIKAKPVHQAYLVQGLYPFNVNLYAYLLEDRRNLPYWFAIYLARETKIQKYFLNSGIVPAFAKIQLIPEDY